MTTATSWRIRGDVMEACSCNLTCPCNFGGDPTQVPCQAIVGLRIQEGNYGATQLNGLNVVLYLSIPGKFFDGGWTLGVYLDQRANPGPNAGPGDHPQRPGWRLARGDERADCNWPCP